MAHQRKKLPLFREIARRKKKSAKKQRSFASLARATLKGLPAAAKKVGRFATSNFRKASKQRKARNERARKSIEKARKEAKKRGLKFRSF